MAPLRQASPAQRRRAASLRRDGALNRLSSITGSIAIATIAAVAGARHLRRQGAAGAPRRREHRGDHSYGARGQHRPGRRRLEFLELSQPAVDPATGCLGASAGHQRIDLMAEADAPAHSQHVYRTRALGTIAELVTDAGALFAASEMLERELERIDLVASRFRSDSELSRLNAAAGSEVVVGHDLFEAIDVALAMAEATDGLVDPTVGAP